MALVRPLTAEEARMIRNHGGINTRSLEVIVGCDESSSSSGSANSRNVCAPVASASAAAATGLASTQVGDDDQGAAFIDHHRHHHGGVAMFLSMSLRTHSACPTRNIHRKSNGFDDEAGARSRCAARACSRFSRRCRRKIDAKKVDAAVAQVDTASTAAEKAARSLIVHCSKRRSPSIKEGDDSPEEGCSRRLCLLCR